MNDKKINLSDYFNNSFYLLLAGFFALRFLSFLLVDLPIWENILSAVVIVAFIAIYYKNHAWGFLFLLIEIFIGGAGQLLEFNGVAIRTCLLILFVLFYYTEFLLNKKHREVNLPKKVYYLLIPFLILIISAGLIGLYNNHPTNQVISDLIPFACLLLIIPATEYWQHKQVNNFLIKLLFVFIVGSSIWALFNFVLFTSGFHLIHDDYYKWLRDVNLGKITQVTQYYYRIVFPEHLLIVPILLLVNSYWLKHQIKILNWLIIASSLILALNFSRGYFLGLAVGLLLLKYQNNWQDWLKIVVFNVLAIFLLFTGVNFLASGGQSLGWEILGLRLSSLAVPTMEESSNNRLLLLPTIKDLIKAEPIIGHGLGQTIEFVDAKGNLVSTRHFDWGYLEMWAEWGLAALVLFLFILFTTAKKLIYKLNKNQALPLGLLTGLASLLIINITAPALSHVLGIIYLALLLSLVWQTTNEHKK